MTTTTDTERLTIDRLEILANALEKFGLPERLGIDDPTHAVGLLRQVARQLDTSTYEYCVMHPSYSDDPHRGPMNEADAREWVRECEEDLGMRPGAFYVARRSVGPWERV